MAYSHCIKKKPRTILPFSITIQDKQDEMLSSHILQDFFSSLLRTASLFWGEGGTHTISQITPQRTGHTNNTIQTRIQLQDAYTIGQHNSR